MDQGTGLTKIYIIAGEDSGDLHAANLLRELTAQLPDLKARGMGGDQLLQAGCELTAHISEGNFMGFAEVIRHLGTIRELFRRLKADAIAWKPDAVVLVDYPGFNLRMAPFFNEMGIPVYYYISPQVWAWKKGRVRKIKRFVDRMFVILPFEKPFYEKEGLEVDYVGHPLLDAIGEVNRMPESPPVIAVLPGSRKQEISRMLPTMLKMIQQFPNHRFIIAGAPSQPKEFYQQFIGNTAVELVMDETYNLLSRASAALVTSGTATLETALYQVPQVVCYRASRISYEIGKRLVKIRFISLVNLIMDKEVVTELIQDDFNQKRLQEEVTKILDPQHQDQLHSEYLELRKILGNAGASAATADGLLSHFNQDQV